jgi:formylglycine-generating enzyme required for sulfatase activity
MDARFAREMLAVGQLNHPNIVAATDAGIANGRRFLVMEYIDGIDLAELCRRVGRLSIADACEVLRQSALGLAHAHDRAIVHRDIKPTNLMLSRDGMVKLLDLGLALLQQDGEVGGDAPLTRADSGPFGTYDYMSPEQWNNSHEVDSRGDIYSLGCTLYFLLTGHAPFDTPQYRSATAKMRGHVLEAPPSIRKERSDVPKRLAAVIERTLAKDPNERYQSAAEFAAELEEFVPGCDLSSLSTAAQGIRTTGAAADVRTDPESATMLVGSSVGGPKTPGSKVKALSATGVDTAVGRSKTNLRVASGVRPKRSRSLIPWLAGGAIALVLLGAGGGYLLSVNGTGRTPGHDELLESGIAAESAHGSNAGLPPGPNTTATREPVAAGSQTASTDGATGRPPQADSPLQSPVTDEGHPGAELKLAAETPAAPVPAIVPVFDAIPIQIVKEQQPFSLLVSLTNQVELQGKIAFALAPEAPQGMRIDPVSGVVRWEPGEVDGSVNARIAVTVLIKPLEPGVESAQTMFEILVDEVNQAPRIAKINGSAVDAAADIMATEGEPVEVLIAGADDDLPPNPLTLEPVGRLPPGAKIVLDADNLRAWKLVWTPGEDFGGEDPVRIPLLVKDQESNSAVVTLAVKVAEDNVAPVIESIGGAVSKDGKPWDVGAQEGQPLELTIVGGDADRPASPLQLIAAKPLPEGASIEAVKDQPRRWKLSWTPAEQHGGGKPVEFALALRDETDSSETAVVLVRVSEVNSPPTLPELPVQKVGAGEPWTLDVPVVDPDVPAQVVDFELEQPDGMDAAARWLEVEQGPPTLRLSWRPDAAADLGTTRRLKLRVRDSGDPVTSAEREFDIEVGRYLRNSIGMQFSLIPAGEFRMGDLDPEQLLKITPKAPPKPPVPNRPAGAPNTPFRNPAQPGQPFDPTSPVLPGTEAASGDRARPATGTAESDKTESATPDDIPVRSILFAQPLYVGAFEVTQDQYAVVMGENPSYFSPTGRGQRFVAELATDHLPVDSVSYSEAVEFCQRLSARPEEQARGRVYRLPTEAEWEYACRAGTSTLFSTGDQLSSNQANFNGRYPLPGMEAGPFLERTATVGSYDPNAFGLHDLHGNVSEWCSDWYAADAYGQDLGPTGPEGGERRVVRGGDYRSQWAILCRSSIRDSRLPTDHVPRIGFRVVLEETKVGPALPPPQE